MRKDFELQFNGKYLNMLQYVSDLQEIGINLDNEKGEITQLYSNVQNKVESASGKDEDYLTNIYTKGIKELDILKNNMKDKYSPYVKIYNFVLYFQSLEITKDNIDKVVNELKDIIDLMHCSSNIIFYRDDKVIDAVYEDVYKVIKSEIMINNISSLYYYTKKWEIDTFYLNKLVKKEIDEINLDNYPNINSLVYKINSDFNSNYFDIDLIKEIMYKDLPREELELREKEKIKDLTTKIRESQSLCCNIEDKIAVYYAKNCCTNDKIAVYKKQIAKKIIALSLATSIPFGVFFGLKKLFHIPRKYYDVTTNTYNSYFDNTNTITESVSLDSPTNNDNQNVLVKRYYPYVMSENPYREIEIYNLPYIEDYELKDYIPYISDKSVLPDKEIERKEKNSTMYDTDYFEIIYKYIDLESEHLYIREVCFDYSIVTFLSLVITILESVIISGNINFIKIYKDKFENIFDDMKKIDNFKIENKDHIRDIIQNVKLLLDEIKKNEDLKVLFNREASKYPELIKSINSDLYSFKPEKETVKLLKKYGK